MNAIRCVSVKLIQKSVDQVINIVVTCGVKSLGLCIL